MKNKYFKILLVLSVMVLGIFQLPSYAAEVYTAESFGHYENPINGKIEDPGNNPGIGEGMVSNVVNGLALIEKDDNGKLYATLRYRLRNQVKNIRMWVYDKRSGQFVSVPVKEVKTEGDTGDFRFEIPSTDTTIKSSFFVEPMGRDVIFFVTFGNIQSGSGDFKVFVSTNKPAPSNQTQNTPQVENHSSNNNTVVTKKAETSPNKPTVNNTTTKVQGLTNKPTSINKLKETKNEEECKTEKTDKGFDHGLLTNKDYNDKVSKKTENVDYEDGNLTSFLKIFLAMVLAIFFSTIVIGAIFIYLYYLCKKNTNKLLEEELDATGNRGKESVEYINRVLENWNKIKNPKKEETESINVLMARRRHEMLMNNEDPDAINPDLYNKINKKNNKAKKDIWSNHPGFMEDDSDE